MRKLECFDWLLIAIRKILTLLLHLSCIVLQIETLKSRMSESPDIRIKVLLDYARGSRGLENNSRQMLLPLMQDVFNDNCEVYKYL